MGDSDFLPQEIIRKKRDGGALSEAEVASFVRGLTEGSISEEQVAAFAMAVFFRGMATDERLALTRAEEEESGDAAILGFLDQTRNVVVGVQAALERAATEHWSTVLEGVHLVPGMVATDYPGAFVVQCVVAIADENLHRSHFWVRDYSTEGLRPLDKYLDSLPQIRQIQDYLVERAHRFDVPVIVNDSLDRAIGDVLDLVLRRADQLVATA